MQNHGLSFFGISTLSYEVASESVIKLYIENDNPLVD